MKWRPAAEADWYLLAGQNIYRKQYRNIIVIFWNLTKVRNMQKLRGVHFAKSTIMAIFWGAGQYTGCSCLFIQGVSLRPCISRNIAQ